MATLKPGAVTKPRSPASLGQGGGQAEGTGTYSAAAARLSGAGSPSLPAGRKAGVPCQPGPRGSE